MAEHNHSNMPFGFPHVMSDSARFPTVTMLGMTRMTRTQGEETSRQGEHLPDIFGPTKPAPVISDRSRHPQPTSETHSRYH